VRQALDRPAITTDVIVGFPGETDTDFDATCRVAEEVGFSKIHLFPFSPRRGTDAATMPDQVPSPVKAERVRRLTSLDRELRARFFQRLQGMPLRVLVEGELPNRSGYVAGTSCRYATVELAAGPETVWRFVTAKAGGITGERIQGALEAT
jgi:threonylcarbamoyladenosine tRNA methylthiotransferase MtaB